MQSAFIHGRAQATDGCSHGRAATAEHDGCGHFTRGGSVLIFFPGALRRHEFSRLVQLFMQLVSTNAAAAHSSCCRRTVPQLVPFVATAPARSSWPGGRCRRPPPSASPRCAPSCCSQREGGCEGSVSGTSGQAAAIQSSKAAGGAWAAQGQGSRTHLPSAGRVFPAACAQIWRARPSARARDPDMRGTA